MNLLPASRQLVNAQRKSEIIIPIPKVNPGSSRFPLMDLTNQLYNSVNEQFQSITGIDFATALSKSKEINVKKQKSKVEKQKIRRQTARKIIFDIQKAKSNTKVILGIHIYTFFCRVGIGWNLEPYYNLKKYIIKANPNNLFKNAVIRISFYYG